MKLKKIILPVGMLIMLIGILIVIQNINREESPVQPETAETEEEDNRIYLFNNREKTFSAITVEGRETLSFVKSEEAWQMIGAEYPVYQGLMKNLEFNFQYLTAEEVIAENPQDISIYGLTAPLVTATATGKDGSVQILKIGQRSATGSYYVMIQDGENRDSNVYTISSPRATHFLKEKSGYRVKELPGVELERLAYFYLKNRHGVVEFRTKTAEEASKDATSVPSQYLLTKPYRVRNANDTDILQFMDYIEQPFRVMDFVEDRPEDLSAYGLDQPVMELRMSDGRGLVFLKFGTIEGDRVYAMLEGQNSVFTMDIAVYNLFAAKKPLDFADRFMLIADISRVRDIHAAGGNISPVTAQIQRTTVSDPVYKLQGQVVDREAVTTLFKEIIYIVADGNIESPLRLSGEPDLSLSFNLENGSTIGVQYKRYDDDFYLAYLGGFGEFLIDERQIRGLTEYLATLK